MGEPINKHIKSFILYHAIKTISSKLNIGSITFYIASIPELKLKQFL